MSLAPLLNAAPEVPVHAFAAMAASVLGVVQFAAPKGTLPHRTIGWIWVLLMLGVAISSFWIQQIKLWGPWSPIHLLSIFTLITVPARRVASAPPSRRRPRADHGPDFHRRACHRRPVHADAGADHAHGPVRVVSTLWGGPLTAHFAEPETALGLRPK